MITILLTAPWLAGVTLKRTELSPLLQIGAILLFANALNSVQIGSLAGFEAFKKIAEINFMQGIATPIIIIPLSYYYGVQGVLCGMIIIAGIGYGLCHLALKEESRNYNIVYRNFEKASFSEARILWEYSLPAVVSGMLVIPVMWLSNAILVNQRDGYGELGLFNAANQWRHAIIMIPQILMSVMLPIFSEIYSRHGHNKGDFREAFRINFRLAWIIALPITIIIISIRNPLSFVFGPQFAGISPIILVLMITAFLNIINNVVGTALAGAGRMWLGAARRTISPMAVDQIIVKVYS